MKYRRVRTAGEKAALPPKSVSSETDTAADSPPRDPDNPYARFFSRPRSFRELTAEKSGIRNT